MRTIRRFLKHLAAGRPVADRPDQHLDYAGRCLVLPAGHALPAILRAHPHYGSALGRLAATVCEKYGSSGVIDIGANVGDTAVLVRSVTRTPILCIEGYEEFLGYLEANCSGLGAVQIAPVFVLPGSESLLAEVVEERGTAFIRKTVSGSRLRAEELPRILEKHPLFRESRLWKIDTDGLDLSIIRANLPLIAKVQPVIHFEYAPDLFEQHGEDGPRIFDDLRRLGYERAAFSENTGDYLATVGLDVGNVLEDLHDAQSGRGSLRYWDVTLFHETDRELAETFRSVERAFWRRARPSTNATTCQGAGGTTSGSPTRGNPL